MAKTYNTIPTVSTGDVYTATAHNNIVTNVNNYRVPPAARIDLTSNVSVANNNATDFAGFTSSNASEAFDTDGMVSLSATPSAITIDTPGVYQVSAQAVFAANGTGTRYARLVRSRSGTLVAISASEVANLGATANVQITLGGAIECDEGDLLRLMVSQNSGGALNLLAVASAEQFGRTYLSAAWLGQVS